MEGVIMKRTLMGLWELNYLDDEILETEELRGI